MGDVKRYYVYDADVDADGDWVAYEDYLALRAECEMVSAQNVTLDEGLAKYEARIDTLESAGKRVIAAFEALGRHNGQIDVLPRAECISAMTAFRAAIDKASGGVGE